MRKLILMTIIFILVATFGYAEIQDVKIGDKIETPFVTLTLDQAAEFDKLLFTKEELGDSTKEIDKDIQDATYIAIKGMMESTAKAPMYTGGLFGKADIDGYEYDLYSFAYKLTIQPFEIQGYYLYALVPNKLFKQYQSCVFYFGFDEDMDVTKRMENNLDDCPYQYKIVIK